MKVSSKNFRLLIDACAPKTSVLSVKVENDRMKISVIDASRVSMVKGEVPVENAEDVEFSIDIEKLGRLIPRRDREMEICVDDAFVKFSVEKKKFKVRKIGVDYSEIKVPELNFSANVVMSAEDFVEVVSDAGVIGDEVVFEVKDGEGVVRGKDNVIDYEYVAVGRGDGFGRYGYMYVKEIADIIAKYFKDKVVEISIGKDIPLKVEVKDEDVKFMWLVAPRIDGV